ncbi:hypothetical protein WDZ17_05420 [Pseudokineococcus basanitobsidens]|uniref:Uncharacterized protein n=1 Tax=Pseudokineococcus basanitobsidens TaxID=1926649 RepID=A0ABU8RI36_9ACTN
MSTSQGLLRTSYVALVVGGPGSVVLRTWFTLMSQANPEGGADIGGGLLWLVTIGVMVLGVVLGVVAAFVRLAEERRAGTSEPASVPG